MMMTKNNSNSINWVLQLFNHFSKTKNMSINTIRGYLQTSSFNIKSKLSKIQSELVNNLLTNVGGKVPIPNAS